MTATQACACTSLDECDPACLTLLARAVEGIDTHAHGMTLAQKLLVLQLAKLLQRAPGGGIDEIDGDEAAPSSP